MEKERRTKWDKRYFILADIHPPAVFWFKNESVILQCLALLVRVWTTRNHESSAAAGTDLVIRV